MENLSFEDWLEEVCKRPLPPNSIEQLEILAMELAEGCIGGYWSSIFDSGNYSKLNPDFAFLNQDGLYYYALNERQLDFIKRRGYKFETNRGEEIISNFILAGYADLIPKSISNVVQRTDSGFKVIKGSTELAKITVYIAKLSNSAFDLMRQKKSGSIFISYKRKESSAFAVLLHNKLQEKGFDSFLDLAIKPGDNWHSSLEDYIKNCDYFIVLIGPTTLESSITIQEIEWAIQYGHIIIPIWHNGFEFKPTDWKLPDAVSKTLATTHTILVIEESALEYHSAVLQLLNYFGITPTL